MFIKAIVHFVPNYEIQLSNAEFVPARVDR
jgi:hypothetical protein